MVNLAKFPAINMRFLRHLVVVMFHYLMGVLGPSLMNWKYFSYTYF